MTRIGNRPTDEVQALRARLAALKGQALVTVAAEAGLSRATAYRLRRSLSDRTPAGTVLRLKAALDNHDAPQP